MANYLVTGGAGFIGSNIVRALVAAGEQVSVLDNLSTGKLANVADVKEKITFIQGDIRNLATLTEAMPGMDYVLHQAALRSVGRSVDSPLETNEVNITGTLSVLLAARDARVKRVVFASSSSVYGNSEAELNTETLPTMPMSPYALTKLTGEHYMRLFSQLYDLDTVSLRYFNVYGPYQNLESKYSAVIPIFISKLVQGQSPVIDGTGEQSRDFTYVADIVQANIKAATTPGPLHGAVYNIGNGQTISVNELYGALQELLSTSLPSQYGPSRLGDVNKTQADISRAKHDLGYAPQFQFREGLAETVAWFQSS